MSKSKKNPAVLEAAIKLAELWGYLHITREMIATEAQVATGTVSLHLGSMKQLRKTIIRHAIRTDNHIIIAQAIIAQDERVNKLTIEEKRTALLAVA